MAKCDKVVVDRDFVCFATKDGVGHGEYSLSPEDRASSFRAFNLLIESGGYVELDRDGYWMHGPLGNQYVSSPLGLARALGFKK